jgi:hypothetical protein
MSQDDVDVLADALHDALYGTNNALGDGDGGLVYIKDLSDAVDIADGMEEGNYDPSYWEDLQEALTDAQAVLDDPDATQSEVDNTWTGWGTFDAALGTAYTILTDTMNDRSSQISGAITALTEAIANLKKVTGFAVSTSGAGGTNSQTLTAAGTKTIIINLQKDSANPQTVNLAARKSPLLHCEGGGGGMNPQSLR